MDASANGCHAAPIEAAHLTTLEAKTRRRSEEDNAEWGRMAPVPFGLLPESAIASLRNLAGHLVRLRFRASRWPIPAVQRARAHSVNGP
jgi:hypothetical protein